MRGNLGGFRGFSACKEVIEIVRFKALTDELKAMLLTAGKLSDCYTESVELSKKLEALLRAEQSSLYLALGPRGKKREPPVHQLFWFQVDILAGQFNDGRA